MLFLTCKPPHLNVSAPFSPFLCESKAFFNITGLSRMMIKFTSSAVIKTKKCTKMNKRCLPFTFKLLQMKYIRIILHSPEILITCKRKKKAYRKGLCQSNARHLTFPLLHWEVNLKNLLNNHYFKLIIFLKDRKSAIFLTLLSSVAAPCT